MAARKYLLESTHKAKHFRDDVSRLTDFFATLSSHDSCKVIVYGGTTNTHKPIELIEKIAEKYDATMLE